VIDDAAGVPVGAASAEPVYVCVRCGKDWTEALHPIMGAPGVTMEALCDCGHLVLADGSETGVHLIDGLVEDVAVDPG